MYTERIDDHWVLDMVAGYRVKRLGWLENLGAGLRGQNLLDARYIGIISNQQDVSEALSTTYYPGAPLTVMLVVDATVSRAR